MILFLETSKETIKKYKELLLFIESLKEDKEYYNLNQEILYTGIINRCYSLWETYNKHIVFDYFSKIKDELIASGELISKLKLHELPAYIVETGLYNKEDNNISYELKNEFITYTSKNIDFEQLKELYSRVKIDITQYLKNSNTIRTFLIDHKDSFEDNAREKDELKKAMKAIISERNRVAHYAGIDDYKNLDYIVVWIYFYMTLVEVIAKSVCHDIAKKNGTIEIIAGNVVNYIKRQDVICIDTYDDVHIKKTSLIAVLKDGNLVDITKPLSFFVNDAEREDVKGNEKVGIKLESIFSQAEKLSKNVKLVIIQN